MRAVLNLVEGLLGQEVGRGDDAGETGRAHRMRQRLDELQSPLGPSRAGEDGTIAFVGATLRSNLRLLAGMVRPNQPERVVARLPRALAGARAITCASRGSERSLSRVGPRRDPRRSQRDRDGASARARRCCRSGCRDRALRS